MELENKEFKVEVVTFWEEDSIQITKNCYPWQGWWINKNQLNALIDILTQLKEEIDGKDRIRL